MSTKPYAVTIEHAPAQPEHEGLKRAAVEMDRALSRLYGAPYQVADHDLAWAWSQMRAELWPAGSRAAK